MSNINIMTGLKVTTQSPLDSKTEVSSVSEIVNYGQDNEKAYTYYKNMRVRDLSTDKVYVWKQADTDLTNVSPLFTYPVGYVVNNINYSNQTYAFYEEITNTEPVDPVPQIEYVVNANNLEYSNENMTVGTIYSGLNTEEGNNVNTTTLHIRPIASYTLRVFNPPNNTGWGDTTGSHIPLRIELYPADSVLVSPDPTDGADYQSIDDVINDVSNEIITPPSSIILLPGNGFTHLSPTSPIDWNAELQLIDSTVLDMSGTLFNTSGSITLGNNSQIVNRGTLPLLDLSNLDNFVITGNGVVSNQSSASLINIGGNVFSRGISSEGVNIQNSEIVLNSGGLIESAGGSITLDNTSINIEGNNINAITSSSDTINMINTNVTSVNDTSNFINLNDSSTIRMKGVDIEGQLNSVIHLNNAELNNVNVKVSNSDLSLLTFNKFVNNDILTTKEFNGVTVSNSTFSESINSDTSGNYYTLLNSSSTTSQLASPLAQYPNRSRAKLFLSNSTLFINTNGDDVDTSTHFIDIVI